MLLPQLYSGEGIEMEFFFFVGEGYRRVKETTLLCLISDVQREENSLIRRLNSQSCS